MPWPTPATAYGICMTPNCLPICPSLSPESTLDALPPAQANALRSGLGFVDEHIKAGVTKQCSKVMDKNWSIWDVSCLAHNVDPYLLTWEYPVPMLQVFGER
jgi:hypothetical protein